MTASVTPPAGAAPGRPVSRVVREMHQRWQRGERPLVEEFLTRYPELGRQPEAVIALVYEELALRQECGVEEPDEELFRRFPQWRTRLQRLLECDRLLAPGEDLPDYPDPGGVLGEFRLVAELGRGARGRVYLATQPALADRPVVLKLTPREGREYLSLARLQHTNVVPLHWVQDDPGRNLRLLCMPYFGGVTLAEALHALGRRPPERRTGRQLVEALDAVARPVASPVPSTGPARQLLARASHAQALCWVGACLADALQYAHERGLVHLDLKPSNVLLTGDGQPMLLDFHLARPPLLPDQAPPEELGGTPPYMPLEQHEAMNAVVEGRAVPAAVDGRADVYALGAILYEALGGRVPVPPGVPPPLHRLNRRVSVGLSDIIDRCLKAAARDRYGSAAALASDLRRHLADLPLRGVANRSPAERWRKWRRRRPAGLKVVVLLLAVLATSLALGGFAVSSQRQRRAEAEYALRQGRRQWQERHYAEAANTLGHGLSLAERVPFPGDLPDRLRQELRAARQAGEAAQREELAQDLHRLTDDLRRLYGEDLPPGASVRALQARCRDVWEQRGRIRAALGQETDNAVSADLLDLAILWTDLRARSAPRGQEAAATKEALDVLDEAESLFGTSAVLAQERRRLREAGLPELAPGPAQAVAPPPPRTAWEHYALGRSFLRAGDLGRAAAEFDGAALLEPAGLWPNYYRGLCAYRRQRYEDAALAFSVCVGAAPENAGCYYHRALAYTALGRLERARADYDRALHLDPRLAGALLNRGMLHYRAGRDELALADLRDALERGADPAMVHADLAVVYLARHDWGAALADLVRALGPSSRTASRPAVGLGLTGKPEAP